MLLVRFGSSARDMTRGFSGGVHQVRKKPYSDPEGLHGCRAKRVSMNSLTVVLRRYSDLSIHMAPTKAVTTSM